MAEQRIVFGARVLVRAVYRRRRQYDAELRADRKWWELHELPTPRTGLYIGYRTLQNGHSDYIDSEVGTVFWPDCHYRAALVVFSERERPVLVPLDCLEKEADQ